MCPQRKTASRVTPHCLATVSRFPPIGGSLLTFVSLWHGYLTLFWSSSALRCVCASGAANVNHSPELRISDSVAQVPTWWWASISNSLLKPLGVGVGREQQRMSRDDRRAPPSGQLAGAQLGDAHGAPSSTRDGLETRFWVPVCVRGLLWPQLLLAYSEKDSSLLDAWISGTNKTGLKGCLRILTWGATKIPHANSKHLPDRQCERPVVCPHSSIMKPTSITSDLAKF